MSSSSRGSATHAIVGRVRRAHGVRGELVVEVMTDAPDAIFAPGARLLAGTTAGDLAPNGKALHVDDARPFKDGLLVTFEEITDRTEAELWRERYLLVPMEELEPLQDDEVYLHQLVGLEVQRTDGSTIGTVSGFFELAHGLLLEIRRTGATDTVLMPYREEFIAGVDVERGVLVVDAPEGLFE
ncbi:MAG: ribosome maturation factor RimM [Gemmatimonadaceae bacterium]|nr:ribosome maturation factor RimM [Gemmatimonadaceae bacterium]